jgi:hypothetical protein
LLAQLVEEVSVLAADHRREKPRTVKRPGSISRARAAQQQAPKHGGLFAAAMAGRVRRV